jgi:hypothetical protein
MKTITGMTSLVFVVMMTGCMAHRNSNDIKPHDAAPGSAFGIKTDSASTMANHTRSAFTGVAPDSLASQIGTFPTNARPESLKGTVNDGTSNLNPVASNRKLPRSAPRSRPNNFYQGNYYLGH